LSILPTDAEADAEIDANISAPMNAPAGRSPSPIRHTRAVAASYGAALLFVVLALAASVPLQRFFPYPFLFLFFAAVMAAAWLGGAGPGFFAVILSTLAIDYFFVPPLHSFLINATDTAYFAAFVACAVVASWVSSSKKRDHEAVREARDHLEARVSERTEELQRLNAELEESIEQREKAQQALIEARAELAHLSRFLTMGELTASIAHEVNQPLTAVVSFGNACVEWLASTPPNLEEARRAAARIVMDGTRAGAVMSRIRSLFRKQTLSRDWFDINEAIQELVALTRHEISRHQLSIRMDLSSELPRVKGDRVQVQQVLLNLIMNAIDAMRAVEGQSREIVVRSQIEGTTGVRVSVEDCGAGFSPGVIEKMFDPFFTTKAQGTGMGLSISRSIVESHHGHLWATPRPPGGAIFSFTVPVGSE